jgi:cytochrome b6-f complex iron-sulfur subunit
MTATISTGLVVAIIAFVILDVFAVVFGLSFVRAQRAQRASRTSASGLPAAPASTGKPTSRRDFFRGSLLISMGVFLAEFGGATLSFLWPSLQGGFGSKINAGSVSDIKNQIQNQGQPVYVGAGRFYVVPYLGTPSNNVDYAAMGAVTQDLMALYQKCAHLGCRVPFCATSKWFECPCHGSKYNYAGEYQQGPAPNGLQRFTISVDSSGNLIVDTSNILNGPPRGTDTIHEPPQGPFCVAPA